MPVIQGAFSRKYLIEKSSDIQDVQNEEQGRRWADLYTCYQNGVIRFSE